MDLSEKSLGKTLGLGLIFSAALLLSACGGSSSRSTTTSGSDTSDTGDSGDTGDTGDSGDTGDTGDSGDTADGGDSKVSGPMDPVQDDVVTGVIVNEAGSEMPSELGGTLACAASALNHLIDGPDAILLHASGLEEGSDPFNAFNAAQADVQASLERFAAQLQSTLAQLADRGTCDPDAAGSTSANNPLGGTPLAPVGEQILTLATALEETEEDPNLTSVTAALAPELTALSDAMDANVPAELWAAPVAGAALLAIADALDDVAAWMTPVGNYDGPGTAAATATLIDNLLSNVLLNVLPMGDIDAATGQDFSGELTANIAALSAELGAGIGEVITPLFEQGMNGALAPLLDPVEGALAVVLHPSALDADSGVWEATSPAIDPLQGALAGHAGDLNLTASPSDALLSLVMAAQAGYSMDSLVEGYALTSGTQQANLSALVTDANAAVIDAVLLDIVLLVEGIFGLSTSEAFVEVTSANLL